MLTQKDVANRLKVEVAELEKYRALLRKVEEISMLVVLLDYETPAGAEASKERSVADIPDSELVKRAVYNAAAKSRRYGKYAWANVQAVFGTGSTFSAQLCRRFNVNPDTGEIDAPG